MLIVNVWNEDNEPGSVLSTGHRKRRTAARRAPCAAFGAVYPGHRQISCGGQTHQRRTGAQQQVLVEGDPRTFAQLIGHIAEWDRFAVLSAGDMLAGIQHPRMISDLSGYIEPDGCQPIFASIDEFNAYQASKHAQWQWVDIQSLAVEMATTLHTLFTHPALLNADRLESTKAWKKRLRNGQVIENTTMGWTLWLIVIEHIAAEHTVELDALAI